MLTPLNIPPGMFRNGTAYQNSGRWYDANLVRWFQGTMRPVGGWQRTSTSAITGKARGIFTWRENDYDPRAAIGTEQKLYVMTGGTVYDITPEGFTPGRVDSTYGYGYGYGNYDEGNYNESPTTRTLIAASTWSLDAWGEKLVACMAGDGVLYEWSNDTSAVAVAIANAPTDCTGLIVTPERHLVAIGPGGVGRAIAWCTSENNTVWAPLPTNSAGSLEIATNSRLLTAKRVRGQILMWTEMELFALQYLGPPYIYGVQKLGMSCGILGPNAAVDIENGAVWMGLKNFFFYDGSIRPLPCDVVDYVFSDFNLTQAAKVYAGHNSRYGEAWWFYPSAGSLENDRYVVWNYRENHWATGNLGRAAWTDGGVWPYPLAAADDGYVYEHESGWKANGTPITTDRFAQSGPVEIGDGERVMVARRVIPDEKTAGQVQFTFRSKFSPEGGETIHGPYTVSPFTDVRFTGRQVGVEIEGVADEDWRVGKLRVDVVAGGGR